MRGLQLLVLAASLTGPLGGAGAVADGGADEVDVIDSESADAIPYSPLSGAHGQPRRGELRWRAVNLLLQDVEYGIAPRVSVGTKVSLPVGFLAVLPTVRYAERLSEGVTGGVSVGAGLLWPVWNVSAIESRFAGKIVMVGGGPQVVRQRGRSALSAGLPLYAVRYGRSETQTHIEGMSPVVLRRTDFDNYLLLLPTVGAGYRAADSVVLVGELMLPVVNLDGIASSAIIHYGMELHSGSASLMLGFVRIQHPSAAELNQTLPLGIPLMSVGIRR